MLRFVVLYENLRAVRQADGSTLCGLPDTGEIRFKAERIAWRYETIAETKARAFRWASMIDQWGRGTNAIVLDADGNEVKED